MARLGGGGSRGGLGSSGGGGNDIYGGLYGSTRMSNTPVSPVSLIVIPCIIFLVAGLLFSISLSSLVSVISDGGELIYDNAVFYRYAEAAYAEEFGTADASEDNALVVILVEPKCYDFHFISLVGDDITDDVATLFGDKASELGKAIRASSINSGSYKETMGQGIAEVADALHSKISDMELDGLLSCSHDNTAEPCVANRSSLSVDTAEADAALERLAEDTGLHVRVLLDDRENVFERSVAVNRIILLCVYFLLALISLALMVRGMIKLISAKKHRSL